MRNILPQLPYGAVYFRKSNPPKEDWDRDYAIASEDGMNIFRHWFMWGAIEVAPGIFDWEDYDRHMDLGAKHGIRTIIAEMIIFAPEWAYAKLPHAMHEDIIGNKVKSQMGVSSAVGGFGGLCLDCDEARDLAGNFLTQLALRYQDHESMLGYDILNECNYHPGGICYCQHSKAKYREWLHNKYGDLSSLGRTWRRYSYTSWEEVQPPAKLGPYPESIDWLQFNKEKFYGWMQWRRDIIAGIDNKNYITAHGEAASLVKMSSAGSDDWEAASKVEIYGFTWVASRKGSEPWKQWHAVDLTRAGSNGKPFWHAEMQGGPLWLQPQVIGRPKSDGRVTEAEDIQLWNMISLAGGARGLLFPRWRSLLDGPLFGAFGPYEMDGSRTKRSQTASVIARWTNEPEQQDLLASSPIKGDIGILVVPETERFSYLLSQSGDYDYYSEAMWGAYRGFFDNHIQADWVRMEQIDSYDVLYYPYPISLDQAHAAQLKKWVANGGTLISEGCPAYFGDYGSVGVIQPNLGLHEVFGAVQVNVEFMPDISDNLTFEYQGAERKGALYQQTFQTTTASVTGTYKDGSAAIVENQYGAGKIMLIGTFPSAAYYRTSDASNKQLFKDIFAWTGKEQMVRADNELIQVRLHDGDGGKFVWIINSSNVEIHTKVHISDHFSSVSETKKLWGQYAPSMNGNWIYAQLPAKDALILQLKG